MSMPHLARSSTRPVRQSPQYLLPRRTMKKQFTPSQLSLSDEMQLAQALKRLRVCARKIEKTLEEGHPLPPPWARAAIIKASIAVYQIAKIMNPTDKKKAPPKKKRPQ